MTAEKDYVLGTGDAELARLGLQHRAWRARALAAWHAAEIGSGQTVLDVGSGPGYASLDLAEMVGPSGRIVAIDKSQRFLEVLHEMSRERNLENIITYKTDLDGDDFPNVMADRAWCRWVLSFTNKPRDVLARLAASLRPKGIVVLHEYFDYSTWRTAPQCLELEEFVSAVMASWRASGGEPDIALSLPRWLEEQEFELRGVRPIVDIVKPDHMTWAWLRAFAEVGRQRLVDLGYLSATRAESIWQTFLTAEATPRTWMISPGVLEIIAKKRGTTS